MFTSSFAGLIPNVGLGPYCVAKYGVVALAETLAREVRANGIGVSVLCPMIVETNLMANTERVRSADYGPATPSAAETVEQLASGPTAADDDSVLNVEDVARLTADAILANRLYILPHRGVAGFDPAHGSSASTAPSTIRPPRAGRTDTNPAPAGSRRSAGGGTSRSRPAFRRRHGWSAR